MILWVINTHGLLSNDSVAGDGLNIHFSLPPLESVSPFPN
jgi:hypothetical protein